jgi:hypothetical protein
MNQPLQNKPRVLPPVTDTGLYYLVMLFRTDGKIEVVTCEEKAGTRINLNPGQYLRWEYVLVE